VFEKVDEALGTRGGRPSVAGRHRAADLAQLALDRRLEAVASSLHERVERRDGSIEPLDRGRGGVTTFAIALERDHVSHGANRTSWV
jgi:hypothetical protein